MKTSQIILALGVLLTLGILASCTGSSDRVTENTDTQTEVSMMTSESMLNQVDARFTAYEGFNTCSQTMLSECSADDTECVAAGLDQCMMEAAVFTGDGSAVSCDQFLSEGQKNSCRFSEVLSQAIQSRDVSVCETLSGEFLTRCTTQVTTILASQSGDATMCESLEDMGDQVGCNNQVLMNLAMQEMDASLCDAIVMYMGDIGVEEEDMPELSDEDNFEKQMCIEQVEMMREDFGDISEE